MSTILLKTRNPLRHSYLCFTLSALLYALHVQHGMSFEVLDSIDRKAYMPVRSCHVTWNLSPSAASFGNRLDFGGIVLLMWGASLPSIHFAFACDPMMKIIHWCFVRLSTTSTAACELNNSDPKLTKFRYRQVQADAYCSLSIRRFWDPHFANIER
jgi:predicted membrane channel-forming protein YqfA (hemolysin III family)